MHMNFNHNQILATPLFLTCSRWFDLQNSHILISVSQENIA